MEPLLDGSITVPQPLDYCKLDENYQFCIKKSHAKWHTAFKVAQENLHLHTRLSDLKAQKRWSDHEYLRSLSPSRRKSYFFGQISPTKTNLDQHFELMRTLNANQRLNGETDWLMDYFIQPFCRSGEIIDDHEKTFGFCEVVTDYTEQTQRITCAKSRKLRYKIKNQHKRKGSLPTHNKKYCKTCKIWLHGIRKGNLDYVWRRHSETKKHKHTLLYRY